MSTAPQLESTHAWLLEADSDGDGVSDVEVEAEDVAEQDKGPAKPPPQMQQDVLTSNTPSTERSSPKLSQNSASVS